MFKDFQVKTISKNVSGTCKFIKKETLTQVFSCEFCEITKNIFFYRTPPVAASKPTLTKQSYCSGCSKSGGIN